MEKEISTDFPSALKEWREKLGLTKTKLAECMGVSKATVSLYETGDRSPSASTAKALIELGFSPEKIPACRSVKNLPGFPGELKKWRKCLKLTQAELAKQINVSRVCIARYETGAMIPSVQAAKALTALGFPPEKVPTNCKNIIKLSNCPMTDEERDFAEIHHGLIYSFLKYYHLNEDDWYDIAVCGYLKAVQVWFWRTDLHQYSFSTIAYSRMKGAVSSERKKASRRPRTVSIDEIIPGTEDFTYRDMLCDPRDCVGI